MPSRRDIAAGLSVAIPLVCLYRHPALVFIGSEDLDFSLSESYSLIIGLVRHF